MNPRSAPQGSQSSRRQLRVSDMQDPASSVRNLNDILRDLQTRLEAAERSLFVEVSMTVDSGGQMSPISLMAPAWEVRGVYLARAWDATNKYPAPYARIGWQRDGDALTVALWIGDVTVSTVYDLTFEVRG